MVADILSDSSRLQGIGIYRNEKITPKVAFKTGTSYRQRDALGVCLQQGLYHRGLVREFFRQPSKALVGIQASVPVAIKIFDWLYRHRTAIWYDRPN